MNIFQLLAAMAIVFIIKYKNGPFNMILNIKERLVSLPLIGVQLFELFNCVFCLGFYVGSIIYLIYNIFSFNFIIFGLATAMLCYITFSMIGE